ncbi:MAG: trehalase family glycosidase [Chthoniobacteraceae bacterium]
MKVGTNNQLHIDEIESVEAFINSHWEDTVRISLDDNGTTIGLPFPYTVPCRKGTFQELYYWDTYFTCLGLIQSRREDLVLLNSRNFLYLINRFGFIPNGSRTYYLNRSQPPYFAALIRLLSQTGVDDKFAAEVLCGLKKEYQFWKTRRATPIGLARFGNHASVAELREFFDAIAERAQLTGETEQEKLAEASHTLSEAESGWDFSPRFDHRCEDFCPVDLNSNLYLYEELLAEASMGAEQQEWRLRAAQRREWLTEFCWDAKQGAFFDYDFKKRRRGTILAASSFHPLWAGVATKEQAALVRQKTLPRLEVEFGIATCERGVRKRLCQWDFPNAWPCLQSIVYQGLARYGYIEDARRVAGKYVDIVCRAFRKTGDLWEKYNAQDGTSESNEEAGWVAPAMMGWTAGVFMDAVAFLRNNR